MSAPTQLPTTAEAPVLQLRVVPTPQPPLVDDDRPLRLVLPGGAVPRPPHRPGPRPRPRSRPHPDDAEFGPAFSSRTDLPDPAAAGRRLVTLTLEVFAGHRPLAQLRPLTSPGVFSSISGGRRPLWCSQGSAPLAVGRVHVCEPVAGVAEISAVARRGGRAHAIAARMEGIDGRWRCTALQIG